MSETPLQHHVEIGPDPHGAADVLASLIRTDQRDGRDLPKGLPPNVRYEEPHGPDRIPAPATVVREGAAACGALARAEASKEKATHVGVCRAVGADGKPVHHAFLVAAAKPGELPLVTDKSTGKSIGPVDLKRVKDPSKDRGMNCGCHVPPHLYQEASFAPIHPDHHHPDHPSGTASALTHAHPAERAAAGIAYQGKPRAHLPETSAGRAVAQVAQLAARAVTPHPGHEPRPVHELHPHPEHPHPEVDGPHHYRHVHPVEHLERMTTELAGALHTIASGRNPHPLPEDPPLLQEHHEAARAMVGSLVKVAKATPAHEHFEDVERQAQVLAVVPRQVQEKLRNEILHAAEKLEHVDIKNPENDFAVTVASELDALLPGVMPVEIGHSLRQRRVSRQQKRHAKLASELIQTGSEPDASLAMSVALMVALDDWHVGCPWDGRRAPPPDYPNRPIAVSDVSIAGLDPALAAQRKALDAAWSAAIARATARNSETAFLDPEVIAAKKALDDFDKAHGDPAVGHGGGGHGGHGGGHGGRGFGGFGWGGGYGLDFLDYELPPVVIQADPLLGLTEEIFFSGPLESLMAQVANHERAVEWRAKYGDRFWEHPTWQQRHWRRERIAAERREERREERHQEHERERERELGFRRGVGFGPEHPGWFGPHLNEHGKPLVVGKDTKGGGAVTWGGAQSGWIPTATFKAGHYHDGRFVPGPVRDHMVGAFHADKGDFVSCALLTEGNAALASDPNVSGWAGWNYRGRDRVIRERRHAHALRRYWNDIEFRRQIDLGNVVDGWDLAALAEILDPPIGGWWSRMWGRERYAEPRHNWWRRNRNWDRGWEWWDARLPASHPRHREWFRRFHSDPDFRRRAEAGELLEGFALADMLAWAQGAVPGSVEDVVVGAYPGSYYTKSYGSGYGGGYGGYRRRYLPPVIVAPPAPSVDQYGNTLDQYGNPVVGPGGGPIMGPNGPMPAAILSGQVPLSGVPFCEIPPELLEPQIQAVSSGMEDARKALKGRPCPTGRCPNS